MFLGVGSKANQKGQETSIDLLLNIGLDEKNMLEIFNQTYLGAVEVDLEEEINSVLNGKNNSIIFGAQVKSFNVNQGNFMGGLGHQAALKDELLKSPLYGNGYSLIGNIAFMGLRNNIIKTLGERNLLFIDGSKQYWMDDFIETFRNRELYLILKTTKEKSTNRYVATSEVALYNYMSATKHRDEIFSYHSRFKKKK